MNLKTLYELKEVLDFCGYHDTIVEDMTNRGIDLESLEDKVNHEQKEIEENVYPNLHGTELLNKENISLLGEEILQYFEKTLEKGDKVWNNNEIDGYSVSAFVEDKKKRYKSLVSWEDEQPFDIYEFLLTQDIEM